MRVQYLSKKNVKEIVRFLESRNDIDLVLIEMLKESDSVKVVEEEKFSLIVADNLPLLFKKRDLEIYVPTLYIVNYIYNTKKRLIVPAVVVDEGAVKPLTRGADVMIPGIRKVLKPFTKGSIVTVLEPNERYAIVVGLALVDSNAIAPGIKGKGIENLSWLNDDIWELSIQLARGTTS